MPDDANRSVPQEASLAIIHLLRGVIYRDAHPLPWQHLLNFQGAVLDYFAVIGLEILLDESEGYAFLRQSPETEENEQERALPRLIPRRPLSYPVSLLCVLLRRKLAEQDATGGDVRVILSRDQIIETIRVFLRESSNEARIIEQIDTYLHRLVEYGFLRKLTGDDELYEVRRVIKALVDAQWLNEMNENLEAYRKHARELV